MAIQGEYNPARKNAGILLPVMPTPEGSILKPAGTLEDRKAGRIFYYLSKLKNGFVGHASSSSHNFMRDFMQGNALLWKSSHKKQKN